MAFPRIPRDKKRNIKIKSYQIPEIRSLYGKGYSQRNIASMYGVSKFCIAYYLMSQERLDELKEMRKRYERENDREKNNKSARETYRHRVKVIGRNVLKHQNLMQIKQYSPERRLEAWQFHKEKLEQLVESDPLITLFRSKKDKLVVILK